MTDPLIIGIAGGTGSGKTTFAEGLYALYPDSITMISYDNYYRPQDHLTIDERLKTNYDCPDALDTDLLIQHLRLLREGKPVSIPTYDFKIHTRRAECCRIFPTPVIIVDGILTFHDERLRELFDIKIFADADADERILRRLRRDVMLTEEENSLLWVDRTDDFCDVNRFAGDCNIEHMLRQIEFYRTETLA